MAVRTDLAIELKQENVGQEGYTKKELKKGKNVNVTQVKILSEEAAKKLSKPVGEYITVEFGALEKIADYGEIEQAVTEALNGLLPHYDDNILVVGLGNEEITSDSIGPATASRLLATRHIAGQFAENIGLKGLKRVSVITPNVLGKTGIEATELIKAVVEFLKPQAVVVIDALCSASISRIFRTVQLSNTGITPGSGVKNARRELSEKTLGIPVIAVGVPTVVDALSLAFELTEAEPRFDTDLIVTPKDSDLLCHRISEILSRSINLFLQPEIDPKILFNLV